MFDRVNHLMLFKKLERRKLPVYIIKPLMFCHSHQNFFVKWGNVISYGFTLSNGTRQGGVLSILI